MNRPAFVTLLTIGLLFGVPCANAQSETREVKEGEPRIGCIQGGFAQLLEWGIPDLVGFKKTALVGEALGWCSFLQPGETVLIRDRDEDNGTVKVIRIREYWISEDALKPLNY